MVNNKAARVAKYAIMFAIIIVAVLLDRVITLGLPIAGATVELLVTFAVCFLFVAGRLCGVYVYGSVIFYSRLSVWQSGKSESAYFRPAAYVCRFGSIRRVQIRIAVLPQK